MTNHYFYFIFFLSISFSSLAQVEDESCLPPKKKVLKLIKEAKSSDPREASLLFKEAIETDDDNALAYYEFAMYAYNQGLEYYEKSPNPRVGDKSMERAEELFKKTLERCSDFHSNCFYYLGIINYSFDRKEEEEAVKYFKEFKAFNSSEMSRYSNDREKRLKDVEEVIKAHEEIQSFLTNEVPFDPAIVKNVSSSSDEYFPMISPDNELMFYTRKVDRSGKGDLFRTMREEFTWSKRDNMHGEFDSGKPVSPPFNDGAFQSYGAATLSVDNKEMIICACKDEQVRGQQYRNCDLYVTYYERTGKGGNDYKWKPLENLGEAINTNDGWEGQPTLSPDGNSLYYTANRPTTMDNDIFVSDLLPDGTWGPARPFDIINTAGKDKSPFFHQDSETFYFVSSVNKERNGVGGTDIFYMRKQEDGSWSKPKNIGYPINSAEDEIGLFVSTDGKEAFFSSRQRGVWNIYSFELYEEARPKSVIVVKGMLEDDEGQPVQDAEIEITYENSDEVQKVRVNGNDGKYAAVVKTDEVQDVMINVKKEGHAFDSQIIEKEVLAKGETVRSKDMEVREIEIGKPYTINDILYSTASAELSKRSKFILNQFARFLKENDNITILIQGHTDNEGDPQKNLTLSEKRAEGVKDYLISQEVDKKRLDAKGYGQTQPKAPNTNAENKAMNRRTDFVIQKM
jgi:outer membrane protein OmpA-like peptidoglycan-associated protein/tetratricopeptide (TPR) repeat protein